VAKGGEIHMETLNITLVLLITQLVATWMIVLIRESKAVAVVGVSIACMMAIIGTTLGSQGQWDHAVPWMIPIGLWVIGIAITRLIDRWEY